LIVSYCFLKEFKDNKKVVRGQLLVFSDAVYGKYLVFIRSFETVYAGFY